MNGLAAFRNSPARITTVVVPSPTCASSDSESSPSCSLCRIMTHLGRLNLQSQVVRAQTHVAVKYVPYAMSAGFCWLQGRPPYRVHTSASWDREMSTRVLAAGCTISSFFMIVAPSLEIVTLPCTARDARQCSWHARHAVATAPNALAGTVSHNMHTISVNQAS